jgi:hypothetical protein
MASTLDLAIVYVRILQKDLAEIRARLEVAEKLMKGSSSSSQTSDYGPLELVSALCTFQSPRRFRAHILHNSQIPGKITFRRR